VKKFMGSCDVYAWVKNLVITHMDSTIHCQSLHYLAFQSSWILSWIFHF
jgi:hypothetical protein